MTENVSSEITAMDDLRMPEPVTDVDTGKATLDEYGLVVHKNALLTVPRRQSKMR